MTLDKNDFFREVTMRICGSLDILVGMGRTLEYLKPVIPADSISMHIYEKGLSAIRTIATTDGTKGQAMDVITPPSDQARERYRKQDFARLEISRPESEPVQVRIVNRPEDDSMIASTYLHKFENLSSSFLFVTLTLCHSNG